MPAARRSPAAPRPRRKRAVRPKGARRDRAQRRSSSGNWTRTALLLLLVLLFGPGLFWLTLPSVEPLRRAFPPSTALIDARAAEARAHGRAARRTQRTVPLRAISPWLRDAVVNSEDARFHLHHGVDLTELRAALEKGLEEGKLGRGASTLTQQLAKNLWLGEERSLWRKAREVVLAQRLESLGKERILELYLNVVEWGEGVYGAEAAARTWFGVPAAELSPEQAAVLAAMLPAPRKRSPRRPSARLKARAAQVLELYGVYQQLSAPELAVARERLRVLLDVRGAGLPHRLPPAPAEPAGAPVRP